jgi:hypothetical protein
MNAAIIFVHYEKVTVIRFPVAKKIPYREKRFDCYGKRVLLYNDGCCFWKAGLAGMHSFRSCIQLFGRSYLPQGERKKLKGRMDLHSSFPIV